MKNSMLKFFKPIDKDQYVESASNSSNPAKRQCMEISDDDIIGDPGNRKPILMYPTNLQDELRRRYLVKGPCQPKAHVFPQTEISGVPRSFKANWFDMFPWLEYSVSKDAAFYLYCYLFARGNRHGAKAFTEIGFKNWKKATENFNSHVGGPGSPHNDALGRVQGYQNQRLNIDCVLSKSNKTIDIAYHTRVTTVVKAVRHLLRQGLPFRGHDESETSLNKGNFLELISYTCNENEEVNKVMNFNAPRNNQLTSHQIQKDVIKACATETVNVILNELDGKLFSILVDESRDCSVKEQMSVIVRFVSDHGEVLERFLGVVHVSDTSAQSLKRKIDDFFALNHLSLSSLRGQGYDGASNMKGHISGLKTLILNENKHAHYVHCFAHQLQLVVVTVAEHNRIVDDFFTYLSMIVNTSGASCKRKDTLRQAQHDKVVESLEKGEISTGKGKNQETSLARPGDTRWGSHYTTVSRLISMWSSVKGVLRVVYNDATKRKMRSCVWGLISRMLSYEFAFIAHFMKHILGMTNALSQYLQMKNQNITNAVRMIRMTKNTLQAYRENGWDELCKEVSEFCDANEIEVPNMEDIMIDRARQLLDGETRTYYRHFYEEIFAEIVDRLRGEFDSRFSESSTELLMCMSCLDPTNSFENFDHRQVFCLAELYEEDFSYCDLAQLKEELELFISEMKANELFSSLEDIGVLAKKMVEMKYHSLFPLTYRLIELVLILPVATASVERSFSAMKIVKTDLRNRMGDDFLTDCMVCYIEKRIFLGVEIETIVRQFQQMKSRRDKLPSIEHCSSSIEYPPLQSFSPGSATAWDGVECDKNTGHVTALHLSSSCLYGSINSTNSLFRLVHLTTLNLAFNFFRFSPIPTAIRNFSRLRHLNLSNSEFSGQIPPEILELSGLVSLDLSDNLLELLQEPDLKDVAEKLTNLVELNLNGVNISSIVPQSLTNLSSLSSLRLRDCNLWGKFPPGIFQLPNLHSLILRLNPDLTGHLPEFQVYRPIELLRLEDTSFSGQLPNSIGKLKSLNNFVVKGCRFSGALPPSIGTLQSLEFLDLSLNNFSGLIPYSIAYLHKLTYLSLASNALDGSIPESIFRIPNLQVLVLTSNRLSGSLSSDLFLKSTSLFELQLSDNNLSLMMYKYNQSLNVVPMFESLGLSSCNLTEFPFFLRGQNKLGILDLSHNRISGLVPRWILDLATESLAFLHLDSNFLKGFEQSSLAVLPWTNLLFLNLTANLFEGSLLIPQPSIYIYIASNNNFNGEFPEAFCNLTSLLTLDLSKNKLSGRLPPCLGYLSNFVPALDLRHNNLSGEIPDRFSSDCALRMMDLSQNRFNGTIPKSLANCSKLESLNLGENQITDLFPHWLGVLPELKVLILRSNGLIGEMGKQESVFQFQKLHIIDLSHNNLIGKLPTEYFNNWIAMKNADRNSTMKYMQADISFQEGDYTWTNHFSYSITITYKRTKLSYERIQEIFTAIDFSGNRFEGHISEAIGNLRQLELLNLSNNILTGHIPSSLGNLKNLEALDLSLNKLSGEIPIQLAQLTFLSSFNVSHNNLTGPILRGNQFETFENDSFSGNSELCGKPLSKKCGYIISELPPENTNDQDPDSEFEFGWKVVIIGYGCGLVIGAVIGFIMNSRKHQWLTKIFAGCLKLKYN